jgi:hypothetical protein
MKFVFMGFERKGEWAQLPAAEQQRRIRLHQAGLTRLFAQRSAAGRPHLALSVGLHDQEHSTILRFNDGKHSITDGPFAETKEVLAGFDLIDFDSREEAVEWNRSLGFDHEGHVSEIRPVKQAGLIYHGHRPTGNTKFLIQFAFNSRPADPQVSEGVTAEYVAKGFKDESICWAGARLADPREAQTFKARGGREIVSDGPFANSREVIGGFSILDCGSHDEALAWARRYSYSEGDVTEVIQCGFWWTQIV